MSQLKEVYEKYKHLDQILTNLDSSDFKGQMLHDFWIAIRSVAPEEKMKP